MIFLDSEYALSLTFYHSHQYTILPFESFVAIDNFCLILESTSFYPVSTISTACILVSAAITILYLCSFLAPSDEAMICIVPKPLALPFEFFKGKLA